MKQSKSISLAIAAVVAVISLSHFQALAQAPQPQAPAAGGGNDLITKTCSSTPHNDLCKQVLQSNPKTTGADLYGLAQILVDIAAENVSNIYETLNQLQNGTAVDNFMDQCLTDCLESYQDAIDQIEDSVTALDFKAYNDVKTWISAAMSDVATCDLEFKEKPGYKSPIAQMSSNFDQLCAIILSFVQLLASGGNVSS